jgi:hypothetical protein
VWQIVCPGSLLAREGGGHELPASALGCTLGAPQCASRS